MKIFAVLFLIAAAVFLFVFFSLSSGRIIDRWLATKAEEKVEEIPAGQAPAETLLLPEGAILVFSQGRQLMALKENGLVIEVANFPEATAGADLSYRRVGKDRFLFFRRGFDLWRWDLNRQNAERILSLPEGYRSLSLSLDGQMAVLIGLNSELKAVSLESKRFLKIGQLPVGIERSQADLTVEGWLADGRSLLLRSAEGSGSTTVWQAKVGEEKIERLDVPVGQLSMDGKRYAYLTDRQSRQSKLWLAETANWQRKTAAEGVFVSDRLVWSTNGQSLFTILTQPEEKLTELVMIEVASGKITWRQKLSENSFPRAWASSADGSRVAVWYSSLTEPREREVVSYPLKDSGEARRWSWGEADTLDWQIAQIAFVKDDLCFTTIGVKPNRSKDSTSSPELSSKLWCLSKSAEARKVSSAVGLMAVIE